MQFFAQLISVIASIVVVSDKIAASVSNWRNRRKATELATTTTPSNISNQNIRRSSWLLWVNIAVFLLQFSILLSMGFTGISVPATRGNVAFVAVAAVGCLVAYQNIREI